MGIAMCNSGRLVLPCFLAALAVTTACVTPREHPAQQRAREFLATLPEASVEGKCKIGVVLTPRGIVTVVGPNAVLAGVSRGDQIVDIESAPVTNGVEIVNAISSRAPSDQIEVVVEREGLRHELSINCLDSSEWDRLARQMAQAALERRWDDCIRVTRELDATIRTATIATARLDCYKAKVVRPGYRPTPVHARFLFEAQSRMINEASFSPDDLNELRGLILASVTFFQQWGYDSLAEDLRDQLDTATSQAAMVASAGSSSSPPSAQGRPGFSEATSYGTCFVVRPDGFVLTAHHVVAGADSISVRFSDGREVPAQVAQGAAANDLALLRVDESTPSYLSLAPARSTSAGQGVFTLGFPIRSLLGEEPKYTDGAISSLSGILGEASLLQTTVPVQPGNSGGPLANDSGEVVGIVTSTAAIERFFAETGSLPQNINWAVKAGYARPLFAPPPPLPPAQTRGAAIERVRKALCSVDAKLD